MYMRSKDLLTDIVNNTVASIDQGDLATGMTVRITAFY